MYINYSFKIVCSKMSKDTIYNELLINWTYNILFVIGGIMLTWIMFMFFLLQLNYSCFKATIISSCLGCVSLGLAFFPNCRYVWKLKKKILTRFAYKLPFV